MKKREQQPKPSKAKSHSTLKRTTTKSKHKEPTRKEECEYVIVGDQFYVAASKTERRTYNLFEEKVKRSQQTVSAHPLSTSGDSV
jgi:hypothetical protein